MRILSELRRCFPSLRDIQPPSSRFSSPDLVVECWYYSVERRYCLRALSRRYFVARSFSTPSEHGDKVKQAHPLHGTVPAGRSMIERSSSAGWLRFLSVLIGNNGDCINVEARHTHTAVQTNKQNGRLLRGDETVNTIVPKGLLNENVKRRHWSSFSFEANQGLLQPRSYSSSAAEGEHGKVAAPHVHDESQKAVVMALWCNFIVLAFKCGVWMTTSSHVMLAEAVHSLADLANQALLAYGLVSSRRAPDDLHPYGYSKERFVWSLISAVGIFCLGSGATIVHGVSHLWSAELPDNIFVATLVIVGSMIMEGASLVVALNAVRKGAAAEGMTLWDYCWRGHDPTAVAVLMEDGAACTGLVIAGMSLVAVSVTGNPIYDPIGSIFVGNLLGMVAIFLIQRNRHALLGRAMDNQDMKRVLDFLSSDPVVDAVYDCKSEVIGPRSYRFKAEIDFNGVAIVQNYLRRIGRETWAKEFREALSDPDGCALDRVMSNYGEEVVFALGSEVDRLEKEIQRLVPGIQHVDIETHNPNGPPQ